MLRFMLSPNSRCDDMEKVAVTKTKTKTKTKAKTKTKTSIWVCLYCAEKFSAQSNINILDGLKSQQSRLMYKNVFRLKKI